MNELGLSGPPSRRRGADESLAMGNETLSKTSYFRLGSHAVAMGNETLGRTTTKQPSQCRSDKGEMQCPTLKLKKTPSSTLTERSRYHLLPLSLELPPGHTVNCGTLKAQKPRVGG